MTAIKQWRGLKDLLQDAVEHGSRAVERVHLETARRPFARLEERPGIAAPARVVRVAYEAYVTTTYEVVRLVNRAVGAAIDAALDAAEESPAARGGVSPTPR